MSKTYIHKSCEIYLPGSPYREDMGSLPLDCILTEEEYEALPAEKKREYCLFIDGKCACRAGQVPQHDVPPHPAGRPP